MNENKLITRDQLKTYFETGKYPTQNQFSDLIDSLRHKQDGLTKKETITLANTLNAIKSGFVAYVNYIPAEEYFPIVVRSGDEEDQIIDVSVNNGDIIRQYFFGKPPYTITTKEFSANNLGENEYYYFRYQTDGDYTNMMSRLFGNNLPTIPEGFEMGELKRKWLTIEIQKVSVREKVEIINTNIRLVNKTSAPVEYMIYAGYWSHEYTDESIVTEHYNLGDFLTFNYRADLTGYDRRIECRLYNDDTGELLMTGWLNAGIKNVNVPGGYADRCRNVRIECDHYIAE
ncbi:hypothetical protein ACQ7CX_09655 [Chryseobacterium arthrosphaerae]|uniref:hypothetical protein n=1 Tax=Chryseobacterium arthrosphaerae TaxID=651561 RepID=UPI001BB088E4|nr:hypothetical protein [Chryseobacterium arthrosphaerae]QUY53710.1 hypothetical protein I2F65_12515 [Chryseobacterium arthrosphaerae]